jgi:hypothetical protein
MYVRLRRDENKIMQKIKIIIQILTGGDFSEDHRREKALESLGIETRSMH